MKQYVLVIFFMFILLFASLKGGVFYPVIQQDIDIDGANNTANCITYVWYRFSIKAYYYHFNIPTDSILVVKKRDSLNLITTYKKATL